MTPHRPRGRPRSEDLLTPGEWRVVEAVRHGLTSRQIAGRRGVSIDAVKYHVANALQKLGLPDRKALRRWTGVARASLLNQKESPMAGQITLGEIAQISRTVTDIDAARAWYADRLGLTHLYSFPGMAFFDCGGVRLYLTQGQGPAPAESILYFRVEDIRAAHAKLEARGVAFVAAPHMIHRHPDGAEEWLAILKDNEGRPLGLMSRVSPALRAPLPPPRP